MTITSETVSTGGAIVKTLDSIKTLAKGLFIFNCIVTVFVLVLVTMMLLMGDRDVRLYFLLFSGLYICWFTHLMYLYARERLKRGMTTGALPDETPPSTMEKSMFYVNCAVTIIVSIYTIILIIIGETENNLRYLSYVCVTICWFVFLLFKYLKERKYNMLDEADTSI